MNTKLTLSINQVVIDEAKEYAKSTNRSLSSIVEEYLKSLSKSNQLNKKQDRIQLVKELKGAVKLPKDLISYKELLQDALIEKYLRK